MADGRHAPHATFVRPDLGSFCRLDELGLQVVGQRIEPGRSVLVCRVVETDEFAQWCRRCGCEAAQRDSVTRFPAAATPERARVTLRGKAVYCTRRDWQAALNAAALNDNWRYLLTSTCS